MVKVTGKPAPAGSKFTVDIEVEDTHNYSVVTSKGTNLVSHNSVSLLAGSTPGVHWPISKYYIRRVRLMNTSNLLAPLKDAGFKIEPCYGSENTTVVVEFPVALDEDIRTEKEVSLWEKMHLAAFIQRWWADNQVSVTITFDPATEANQIEPALQYFQYSLKSVSFLPQSTGIYPQMPYEPITKEKYEELASKLGKLTFRKDLLSQDGEKEMDVFCDSESCVIGSVAVAKKRKLDAQK